jgi:hypothetical protein
MSPEGKQMATLGRLTVTDGPQRIGPASLSESPRRGKASSRPVVGQSELPFCAQDCRSADDRHASEAGVQATRRIECCGRVADFESYGLAVLRNPQPSGVSVLERL